ncbi:TPA: energy transducer TonB [Providencia stuartii]|uniref:energy transducer TonB n=1 Tax=Providencia stuartii TaxID=588 RepID=UPI00123A39D9|nr:energy transducer TonB [Providencia stuartii]QET96603.1 energy transducer TonB [Providencia stuartii]HEM8142048.1 energy transducer TonB [Providencia stuartii]HEM8873165.1 energy transducer TonB [Providencia stuartii]
MSTITFEHYQNQSMKMGSAVIVAIALHFLVIGLFLRSSDDQQWDNPVPPPSVVVEVSMEAEAKQVTEVNIGQVQEVSVASKAQEAEPEQSELPTAPVNENAELLVTKTEKKKPQPTPKKEKKEPPKKPIKKLESDNSKSNSAPVTSDAAALKQSSKIAADFNSQSQSQLDAEKAWQALVLGQLNKFKRYPDDARRRNRTGIPVVEFDVDAQGYVIKSSLIKGSGTRSLDREAEKVLSRAQPLPIPPAEMLRNGKVTVRMPIDFTLEN